MAEAYRPWNRANAARLTKRYPGIEDMLRKLLEDGIRVGVVSEHLQPGTGADGVVGEREDALAHAGLTGLIDLVATMESTTRHKPDPDPLIHGAARLSTPVERCAYVGDAVVDVLAAKAAGMRSIAVTWGAGGRADLVAAGADAVVDDAAGLRTALLG